LQKSPFAGMQQQGRPQQQQQLSQPAPQLYPYAPPSIQQPQQKQPFVQAPPLSSQLPFNSVPMNLSGSPSYSIPYVPPLSQPTEIPPRILSDNNYFSSTGTLRIVGEIVNESFEPAHFVKTIAITYSYCLCLVEMRLFEVDTYDDILKTLSDFKSNAYDLVLLAH
jgi:hypothetical protein